MLNRRKKNNHHAELGQSTIEFLSVIVFSVGIIFVFVQLAFNAVDGYLIHYATYMASRTYMTADTNSNVVDTSDTFAQGKAKEAFDSLKISIFGYGNSSKLIFNKYSDYAAQKYEYVGVSFPFEQKISPMPIVSGNIKMNMTSDSFLGKEPPKQECLERIIKAMTPARSPMGAGNLKYSTFFDNGC